MNAGEVRCAPRYLGGGDEAGEAHVAAFGDVVPPAGSSKSRGSRPSRRCGPRRSSCPSRSRPSMPSSRYGCVQRRRRSSNGRTLSGSGVSAPSDAALPQNLLAGLQPVLATAIKDNDFMFHDRIPQLATLPKIARILMVKATPVQQLAETAEPLFSKVGTHGCPGLHARWRLTASLRDAHRRCHDRGQLVPVGVMKQVENYRRAQAAMLAGESGRFDNAIMTMNTCGRGALAGAYCACMRAHGAGDPPTVTPAAQVAGGAEPAGGHRGAGAAARPAAAAAGAGERSAHARRRAHAVRQPGQHCRHQQAVQRARPQGAP